VCVHPAFFFTLLHVVGCSSCATAPGVGQLADGVPEHYAKEWASFNARYLLGYNEPDYGDGHNHPHMVDPADAAKDWVLVQKAAEDNNLKLVSPAISTTGCDNNGVSQWFDEFFGNCSVVSGCNASKIECVTVHAFKRVFANCYFQKNCNWDRSCNSSSAQ
jgi:hypothetical protein